MIRQGVREKQRARLAGVEEPNQLFQFFDQRLNRLFAAAFGGSGIVERQPVACTADGETFNIEQAADLANQYDVVALIVTPIAPPFDRLQLGELLLPIPQDVRLDRT